MDIFDFFDYRLYLEAFYNYKKAHSRAFSYRSFAQRAGYTSSGLYIDLVKGKKNLTSTLIDKFVKGLHLNEREAAYFRLMVDFTHAEKYDSKQNIFDEMTRFMPDKAKKLHKNQWDYYRYWHNVVVREALSVVPIDENYGDLQKFIRPKLTLPQIKKSIRLLADLGLIEKQDGLWKSVSRTIKSGKDADADLVRAFQKQMMDLGKDALDEVTPDERNISCVTFSISEEGLKRIRQKVDSFRQDILNIVRSDEGENRICQFNVQFFPLSEKKEIS